MKKLSEKIVSSIRAQVQRFTNDERGVSAVEFTLVLPLMALLAVGSWEITKAIMVKRKNVNLATSIANLAAQDDKITASDWTTFSDIANKILYPYDGYTHRLGMKAVQIDNSGKLKVVCTYGAANVDETSLPAAMQLKNTFYIMTASEVDYVAYNKDMEFYGSSTGVIDMTFRDTAVYAPRNADEIDCN